jgi:hypothetical protein
MSKLIRYRLRPEVTLPCNIRIFKELAVVMRPQGRIYSRTRGKQRCSSCRRPHRQYATFVFWAFAACIAVVRGVSCDHELDGDGDDDGDDDQPLDFDASLGAIMIL